jgi:hypothetical protein
MCLCLVTLLMSNVYAASFPWLDYYSSQAYNWEHGSSEVAHPKGRCVLSEVVCFAFSLTEPTLVKKTLNLR